MRRKPRTLRRRDRRRIPKHSIASPGTITIGRKISTSRHPFTPCAISRGSFASWLLDFLKAYARSLQPKGAMTRSLKDFFRILWTPNPPRFQYLQVEVTTRCDLPGCLICPRRAWPERWLNHDLSWQKFERLIPALKLFTHVHLSDWGEPLLHSGAAQLPAPTKGNLIVRGVIEHRIKPQQPQLGSWMALFIIWIYGVESQVIGFALLQVDGH